MDGKIIREKGSILGIRIDSMQHDVVNNILYAKVCYFPLNLIGRKDKSKAGKLVMDDKFSIPEPVFRDRYEILTNADTVSRPEDMEWAPITSIEHEE